MSEPVTREEQLLSAIAGGGDILSPITRQEMYLAYLAGDTSISLPEPVTRKEQFLYQACLNGGSGGGGSISLQDKTITENGEYTADAGYDGLGTVTVDVAGSGGSDEDWIIGDGNTHLWITLTEGRTSPMLGVGVNGTVTVDWGDGSTPDVLTGTRTWSPQWTPNHEYAVAGNYVITLTIDGEVEFLGTNPSAYILRHSSASDTRNSTYQNALKKIEIGNGVISLGDYAFCECTSLENIAIANGIPSIGNFAFSGCYSLASVAIPDSAINIGTNVFESCYTLQTIIFPENVTSIKKAVFSGCLNLESFTIPPSVTSIVNNAFYNCNGLTSITIPDNVTSIAGNAFYMCQNLTSVKISKGVTSIDGNAFNGCYSVKFYDFTDHTAVPTLSATNVFQGIPADCEIRVPAALADAWKAATNWTTYADYIVGV